jgi:hypothetical protein
MGSSLRIPCALWGWRATLVVVGILVLPAAVVLTLGQGAAAADGAWRATSRADERGAPWPSAAPPGWR